MPAASLDPASEKTVYIPVCQPLVLQALRPACYSCGHGTFAEQAGVSNFGSSTIRSIHIADQRTSVSLVARQRPRTGGSFRLSVALPFPRTRPMTRES